jgi:hypothetical protein
VTDPHITGPGLEPGQQHTRDSVLVDTRGAVLLDAMSSCAVETSAGPIVALDLAGKLNREERRSSTLYLFDFETAAKLAADLLGLCARAKRNDLVPVFQAHLTEQL